MKRPACHEPASGTDILNCCNAALLRLCAFVALIPAIGPALVAQTGNVVITTNTTYATGTYNLTSLTVESGATLTIGGGSTVTVSGAVLVTANSNLVLQSINNSAQVNGAWGGVGVTLNAGTVEVDAGSSLNADGQGYTPTAGPGAGPGGTSNGGSYGGAGGTQAASTIYGSATAPMDLGSGGGQYQGSSSPGGGAIRLVVTGALANNGIISANSPAVCCFVGGSAGGSVYVTAGALTGSGTFNANGGSNTTSYGSGGGGGRVAVYYNATQSSFTGFAGSTASGGTATPAGNGGVAGAVGTVAFFDTSATNDNATIYQNYVIPANSTVHYNSLTVTNGATLTVGGGSTLTVSGAIVVTANSNIVLQSINTTAQVNGAWAGVGVTVNAGSVQVDGGSSLNADGQGYIPTAGPGAGPGGTTNGGSYGGAGGAQAASTIYGSAPAPVDLGSGGGQYQGSSSPGGGAIRLIVSGTVANNGVISSNALAVNGFIGGSAGGSVYVTAGALTGSGTFNANGGANTTSYGNGGGGGRVAVYYNATQSSFTGFAGSTASGGTATPVGNGGVGGTVGTAAFFDTSAANDNVTVYQNYVIPAASNMQYNSLTVANGALVTVGGGSTVTVAGAMLVTGDSNIVLESANTSAQVNGVWAGVGDTIQAGSLEVDAGSTINADAQGYTAGAGPGGATGTNGGSYGGIGGGQTASTTYGSSTMPADLGSGGGSYESTGGTGGGAMHLVVSGKLTNNGVVSANGGTFIVCTGSGACGGGFAGGGAGGSINVSAGSLAGSGTFNADGGSNTSSYGSGGGGGRIVIFYDATQSSFTGFTDSTVSGGVIPSTGNGAVAGAVGSLAFFDTSATNDNVAIYQNFTLPAGSSLTYNSVTVQNGALLTIGGGTALKVTQGLTVNGTVVAQSANNTVQINGAWTGSGVSINAASINVNANGSLNADGQGYVAGAGPGGSPAGTSAGGSYGGLGGVGNGSAPAPTYGSEMLPVDLGSGGGTRCCGTVPGAGGGDILLTVSGTLTDDGVISANGGDGTGTQVGGGSGGSVSIHTPALTGTGSIAANGGSGGEAGGGGGRVALYFNSDSGFNVALATATGGNSAGGNAGAVGTVYIPGALVLKTMSSTALTASPVQPSAGQTVTFKTVVTAAEGGPTPTGAISFLDGTKVIATETLAASQQAGTATAQFQTTTLTAGTHSITASYAGDENVATSSSAAQTVTVSLNATTSTLGLSAATITFGQAETLTMTVAEGSRAPALTGTVSFFDTTVANALGSMSVTPTSTGGTAVLAVSTLTVGTHVLNARYSGDANYQATTTPNQTVVVAAKAQTVTFAPIPDHVFGDAPFTLNATASSGLPVSYAVTIGPATVSGNTVTISGAGTVSIQAAQAGDTSYSAATPVTQTFTVSLPPLALASIAPSGGVVSSGAITITLTGNSFAATDTVQLNGAAIPTTFASTSSLTAIVPASFLAATGTGQITVFDSATKSITAAQTFTVFAAPDIDFSGPSTATSGSQPTLTFQLVNPYPFPIVGALSLSFTSSAADGVSDPAVQFSAGGQTLLYTIPALSQVTPSVQIQSGTVAGTATVTLVVTSNGVNVTPANVTPVQITIPPAVPMITTASLTRSGTTLTVVMRGFSNTRELSTAVFHFTPADGNSLSNPDVTIPATTLFANYFTSPASAPYGSTFVYTQNFTLNGDASSVQDVIVTLVNSIGDSIHVTTQ